MFFLKVTLLNYHFAIASKLLKIVALFLLARLVQVIIYIHYLYYYFSSSKVIEPKIINSGTHAQVDKGT